MSSLILRATELARLFLAMSAGAGDTVIDATAGRGRDSCFLAALVGPKGQLWAFDIQEQACRATEAALLAEDLASQSRVICDDHANIGEYPIEAAAAAVFNLGWLPGSDHAVVSSGENTLKALVAVLDKLCPGGVIVVVAYPGHEAGAEETAAIQGWLATLPAAWAETMQIIFPGKSQSPVVIVIEKKGEGLNYDKKSQT